jgi:hypothetical protein
MRGQTLDGKMMMRLVGEIDRQCSFEQTPAALGGSSAFSQGSTASARLTSEQERLVLFNVR